MSVQLRYYTQSENVWGCMNIITNPGLVCCELDAAQDKDRGTVNTQMSMDANKSNKYLL